MTNTLAGCRFQPLIQLSYCAIITSLLNVSTGGSGEIRTHGPFRIVCFQDRCIQPGSATLPKFGAPEETRTPKIWLLRPTRIPIPSPGQNLPLMLSSALFA
jgi:hypothetical protein